MNHIPTFTTNEFHWLGWLDQPRHELRTFWFCSCGRTSDMAGHKGGYTTPEKAKVGHRLHALRSPIKEETP